MADLKFRKNGLRILDSRAGDLLIADPQFGAQIMFTAEFIALAKTDPQKMGILGRRLLEFIENHTERRWKKIEEELKQIEATGAAPHFIEAANEKVKRRTIDELRKLEKDIYFFKNKHG